MIVITYDLVFPEPLVTVITFWFSPTVNVCDPAPSISASGSSALATIFTAFVPFGTVRVYDVTDLLNVGLILNPST